MKYMLVLIGDESQYQDATPRAEQEAMMQAWDEYTRGAGEAGVFVAGEGLQPSATATTRARATTASAMLTDGPFAETKEQLGGFYLIECARPRRGDRLGGQDPRAPRRRLVEVRPVMDYEARGRRGPAAQRGGGLEVATAAARSSTACSGASRGGRSRP